MEKKSLIQKEALQKWLNNKFIGTLAIATGVGKTKIAIDALNLLYTEDCRCLLVVPTENLRDKNWKEECEKWDSMKVYSRLARECYVNLSKIKGQKFDLVILDEAHCITENNSEFFKNNQISRVLALTATPPKDRVKFNLLNSIAPIIFEYTLENGIKDGIITPFKIKVVDLVLDNKDKYVKAGSKAKPFLQTEEAQYSYLDKLVTKSYFTERKDATKFALLARMRFIYNIKSKTKLAQYIIDNYMKDERSLIFAGRIEQAEELCKETYHSKTNDTNLSKFQEQKIQKLSCVQALNQGINIPNVDSAIITQLKSKDHHVIQQIGRVVRWREDHIANIWVLRLLNTVDEDWVNAALAGFDPSLIEYIYHKNI